MDYMKRMSTKVVMGIFVALASLFLTAAFASAQVTLRTVPSQPVMKADGITIYKVDVYADAMSHDYGVKALQWKFSVPNGVNLVSADYPSSNDFFAGTTEWYHVLDTFVSNGILANYNGRAILGNVLHRSGKVATYTFTISPNAASGMTQFGLGHYDGDYSGFVDTTDMEIQPANLESVPFTIYGAPKTQALSKASVRCVLPYTC